jgi:hypothetical protein
MLLALAVVVEYPIYPMTGVSLLGQSAMFSIPNSV